MNRTNYQDIYRTDHQKFTTYRGDGAGRDHYIIFEDGGLMPRWSDSHHGIRDPGTYNRT